MCKHSSDYKILLDKIENLEKKEVFSIGCGSGKFEHGLVEKNCVKSIDCI